MIVDIINRHGITAIDSFMIGDKDSDIEAATAANLKSFKFSSDDLLIFVNDFLHTIAPDTKIDA